MRLPDTYQSLAEPALAEYKDKGSRFIAHAQAVRNTNDIRSFLEHLRNLHPKATHHCYAYRLGFDKQDNYRANDDGEPSGSAGKPILGQIDSKGLTQTMVIVVRYFGGTKLGVPGLINAYKQATAAALQKARISTFHICLVYSLQFGYHQMNEVMQSIKRENAQIVQQNFAETCTLQLSVPKADSEQLLERLQTIDELLIHYDGWA